MRRRSGLGFMIGVLLLGLGALIFIQFEQDGAPVQPARAEAGEDLALLVSGLKGVAVASVSDAIDRVTGKRGFMSHQIRPLFPAKIAGPAVTVLGRPSTKSVPPTHALEAIDTAPPGSVLVIVMEQGEDVAGIGGLMATAASVRGLEGAILDAGARDVAEIEALNFPVFSKSIIPSTSVGRYETVAKQIPVMAGGVEVRPGDIVVGDRDGVVVVPREKAAEVLKVAQQIDELEKKMVPEIRRLKSILKAVELFRRI